MRTVPHTPNFGFTSLEQPLEEFGSLWAKNSDRPYIRASVLA